MAFTTILYDTYRHAWRRRIPVALAALILLGLMVMPQILKGDGSAEGELRLFLLYAGQCALFALTLLGVGYAIWSEGQDRRLGVDQLIATRPVGFTTLLGARILALLSILLLLTIVDMGLLFGVAWKSVLSQHHQKQPDINLKERLAKVHQFEALYYLGQEGDLRPTGKKVKKKVKLDPGVFHHWTLPLNHHEDMVEVSGQFLSIEGQIDFLLDIRVHSLDRALWRHTLPLMSGQPFRISLPPALQDHENLTMKVRQTNSLGETLTYTSHHPFKVRVPGGSIWVNIVKALLLLGLLWFYLLTFAFVMARLLPPLSSLLPIALITLVGTFRNTIHEMLFPVSRIPDELRPGPGLFDILYLLLWKPILTLIPDFQAFNPIPSLARGEMISLDLFPSQLLGLAFLVAVALFITRVLLPRRERLPQG